MIWRLIENIHTHQTHSELRRKEERTQMRVRERERERQNDYKPLHTVQIIDAMKEDQEDDNDDELTWY